MADGFAELKNAVDAGTRIISLAGLTSTSAKAYVLARLQAETRRRFVVVADTNTELESWTCDLNYFAKPALVSLPSFTTDPYSGA